MITNAPVAYFPKFVLHPDAVRQYLADHLEWERRDDAPRCEYYCNDFLVPYTYGKGRGQRTYQPHPYPGLLTEIRRQIEVHTGTIFEACFLNRYLDQSDHLGWHSDDSPEMDDARPIATISLGAEREIWFQPKLVPLSANGIETLLLENGSLALMAPGMQDEWRHRIPKSSAQCGERISLTFRGFVGSPT